MTTRLLLENPNFRPASEIPVVEHIRTFNNRVWAKQIQKDHMEPRIKRSFIEKNSMILSTYQQEEWLKKPKYL